MTDADAQARPTPLPQGAAPEAAAAAAAGDDAALVMVSGDLEVLSCSASFVRLTGCEGAPGQRFDALFGAEAAPQAQAGDVAVAQFALPSGALGAMVWSRLAGGGWTGVLAAAPGRGRPVRTDPLTGLGDRAYLASAFERMMAERGDGPAPVVLVVDLDRFKPVNDTLGHAAGDALLKLVADRIRRALRDRDELARVGGDEFVALIAAPPDRDAAEAVAARIVDTLARPFLVGGSQALIGATVGLAEAAADDDPGPAAFQDALQRADIALYEGKRAGRGCGIWFEPAMRERLEADRSLEAEMRRALVTEAFELRYQPQHRAGAKGLRGFEALLRWNHPARGMILPDDFIDIAERTHLIVPLGAWVLEHACRTAAAWPDPLSIAVNVSPIQLMDPGFIGAVDRALALSGLAPRRLDIELTESVLIADPETVSDRIEALRDRGVRLSLDDFGTGYASLTYLRRFRFDTLKIDKSFIIPDGQVDDDLTQAIVEMGSALGLEVLAEGVETEGRLEFLEELGDVSVQGFHFGRPMSREDAEAYLSDHAAAPRNPGGSAP